MFLEDIEIFEEKQSDGGSDEVILDTLSLESDLTAADELGICSCKNVLHCVDGDQWWARTKVRKLRQTLKAVRSVVRSLIFLSISWSRGMRLLSQDISLMLRTSWVVIIIMGDTVPG